jgi:hypothetical protein
MIVGDKVYVCNWGQTYSDITKYENGERVNIFPFKTKIPDYTSTNFHYKFNYEPNLTLKGTINKREPKKLVSKEAVYKQYKYEVLEIVQHPSRPKVNLLLISSLHTDIDCLKCYVVIEESGVTKLTLEEFTNNKFNALINAHLGKYSKKDLTRDVVNSLPEEIVSRIYDKDDNVLFGSSVVKGKVYYNYLDGKYTVDGVPLFLHSSISYDGKGNSDLPKDSVIMDFSEIKAMFPHNK